MSKYDIIAFDLDGTLTDPSDGLIAGFVYCFKKLGLDSSDRESLRKYIGPSLYDEWQHDFGFSPDEANHAIEVFREYYNIYGWWDNRVYPGIHELLGSLRAAGKKLIIATSKPEDTAKRVLNLFGLTKYFDFIGGAGSHKKDRKWEVLEYSLTSAGVDMQDKSALEGCILVGDRCYDAEGARICGIDSLGVLWGHGTDEEMNSSGFTHLAKDTDEAFRILTE
ncbi:MAG: HAD hydrolase-like protein [Clostridia bacterium]|nr:HAD hydrolase-like protein [Clostridia bacterium]